MTARKLSAAFYERAARMPRLPDVCPNCGRTDCPLARFLAVPAGEGAAMVRDCEEARKRAAESTKENR